MPIKMGSPSVEPPAREGWLEVSPRWLAGLWGLESTGRVETVFAAGPDGRSEYKIRVSVRSPHVLAEGQVVVGHVQTAILGVAVESKDAFMARVGKGERRG